MEVKSNKPTIAIVTFTDDREVGLFSPEIESYLSDKQNGIKNFLTVNNITVYDPLEELRAEESGWYGLRSLPEIDKAIEILSKHKIEAAIIGSWGWSSPMLIMQFIRKFGKPFMLYSENNACFAGLSQLSASGASLLEWGVNEHALRYERNFGNKEKILKWIRGISAISKMRESALLLWGGTYAIKMEQLQDDIPRLKSFFIRDVLIEDQYILVNRAEKIIRNSPERIEAFIIWAKSKGLNIKQDEKMLTNEALKKQVALLISARDRLEDLRDENISGVSIKCQPEIYFEYGVDACTLPAFLPFAENEIGPQKIYPTVCEGDIKGLLSSMLLHMINPDVPPAFGDLISVEDDHIEFANCGAGSIYWANNSLKAKDVLPHVFARANNHGVSGAAFGYFGVESPVVTIARLTRIKGEYYMQLGKGKALNSKVFLSSKLKDKLESHIGYPWGKVVVDLGVKAENFVKVVGANHLSGTTGDVTEEVKVACREISIPVIRIDSDDEMSRFYEEIRY
jgi:L-fucose isomerase-like protein